MPNDFPPPWVNVTDPDPTGVEDMLESLAQRPLHRALASICADPGRMVPRRMRGLKDEREYEDLPLWQGRACAAYVQARLGL